MADEQGMTSLQLACRLEDHEMIKLVLNAKSVDVNKQSKEGSALFLACNKGNVDTVALLLEAGADATATFQGSTLLHIAAIQKEVEIAATLLEHNLALDSLNSDGKSALMIASQNWDDAMASLLLAKGADARLAGADLHTALHIAAASNSLGVFKLLLEAAGGHLTLTVEGKSVLDIARENKSTEIVVHLLCNAYFIMGEPGSSPLHWACENDQAVVFKMLASYCVDLEYRDKYNRTPLHLACEKGNREIVDFLLDFGADSWAVDINNETPLHKASSKGHHEIAKLLLKTGTEVNAFCRSNATPLHRACANDHFEVVKVLLEYGGDPTRKDNLGRAATHIATDPKIIEALQAHMSKERESQEENAMTKMTAEKSFTPGLTKKESLEENAMNKVLKGIHLNISAPMMVKTKTIKRAAFMGRTPLHEAAEKGELHVIRYRMDQPRKPAVDRYDINGDTPLHLAVANGHIEVCEILIQEGKATINARNRDKLTPLAIAAKNGYQTIAQNLLDSGADASMETPHSARPLQIAANGGHEGVINVLLGRCGSHKIDHRTHDGETALHIAARGGHAGICRALLSKKSDPDATLRNGETPIFLAIKGGHLEAVRVLLEKGASKNAKGPFAKRPLHVAVLEKQEKIVELLLKNKANPNSKDIEGVTPLYVACVGGYEDIVNLLLKRAPDVNAKIPRSGDTPLHAAARAGVPNIVEMLLRRGAKTDVKNARDKVPVEESSCKEIKNVFKAFAKLRKANAGRPNFGRAASEMNMNIVGSMMLLSGVSLSEESQELPDEALLSDDDQTD
jgi:ankyrin repeat protein